MKSQKIGLIVGIISICLVTGAGLWWLLIPKWTPLLDSTVDKASQHEVLSQLTHWGVNYKLDHENDRILVLEASVNDTRARLADIGIPAPQELGLEVFSDSDYGMSEFSQRINYQRGLEGEIARTIRSFVDVRMARVHLTLPKQSIFKDRQSPAKASVVIQTNRNQRLTVEQVNGVQALVAAAVESLTADQVIILDEQGNRLSVSDEQARGRDHHMSMSLEDQYGAKVLKLVKSIVPNADVQVAVNAKINFDKVRSVKEQIIPADNGTTGFVTKSREQKSTTERTTTKTTASNPSSTSMEKEYAYSKERSEIEYAAGDIERLSVGIVIAKIISDDVKRAVEQVVSSALGLNITRGDNIAVVSVAAVERPDLKEIDKVRDIVKPQQLKRQSDTIVSTIDPKLLIGIFAGMFVLILILSIALLWPRKHKTTKLTHDERLKLVDDINYWLSKENK